MTKGRREFVFCAVTLNSLFFLFLLIWPLILFHFTLHANKHAFGAVDILDGYFGWLLLVVFNRMVGLFCYLLGLVCCPGLILPISSPLWSNIILFSFGRKKPKGRETAWSWIWGPQKCKEKKCGWFECATIWVEPLICNHLPYRLLRYVNERLKIASLTQNFHTSCTWHIRKWANKCSHV